MFIIIWEILMRWPVYLLCGVVCKIVCSGCWAGGYTNVCYCESTNDCLECFSKCLSLHNYQPTYIHSHAHMTYVQGLLYSHIDQILSGNDWLIARLKTKVSSGTTEDALGEGKKNATVTFTEECTLYSMKSEKCCYTYVNQIQCVKTPHTYAIITSVWSLVNNHHVCACRTYKCSSGNPVWEQLLLTVWASQSPGVCKQSLGPVLGGRWASIRGTPQGVYTSNNSIIIIVFPWIVHAPWIERALE